MREQLRDITEKDYWVYGITESDFDHAVDLVREMLNARTEQYEKEAAKVRSESPDLADDILDDVAFIDIQITNTFGNLHFGVCKV